MIRKEKISNKILSIEIPEGKKLLKMRLFYGIKKIIIFSFIFIAFNLLLVIPNSAEAGSCGTPDHYPTYSCVQNPSNNYICTEDNIDNENNKRCDNYPAEKCCRSKTAEEISGESKTLPNPLGTTDIKELIARIIKIILGLVGAIAVALFVYGGLVWMTAGGNSDKIRKGKDVLVWAIMGLVVIFTSYIVLNFIFKSLEKVTK